MKLKHFGKLAAVAGVVALSLSLTGCYIPPDEISNNTQDISVGSQNMPFNTIALTPTPTPTARVTATPTPSPTMNNTINNLWTTPTPAGYTPDPYATFNPFATAGTTGSATTAGIAVYTPTPTDTPVPTALRVGSTGQEVRNIQQRLKDLGYLKGNVDGDFGSATEEAVKAFQKHHGLTADGLVGKQTQAKLDSTNAYTAPPAVPTPTPTPRATATPRVNENTYLQVGSSGSDVRQLQNRLIQLGWMAGQADGYFGGATEYAVKRFQSRTGLHDDGVAGPDTLRRLYASGASTTSTVVSSIGQTLRKGDDSAAVRAMQTRLKSLGYLTGYADGSYGDATETAVRLFQGQNGLTADGVAGTATLNKLYSNSAKSYSGGSSSGSNASGGSSSGGSSSGGSSSGNNTNTSDIASTGYITLREGDKADAVETLQRRLKNLGYYDGYVDGTYGSGTTAAVKAYQQDNNLKADGIAGPATQRALYGTSSTQTYSTLRLWDEGSGVKNMQYTLYELGYYDDRVDGIYGNTTADAVRAFQIANNIEPVDGIAGNKTLQVLYSSNPIKATTPTTTYETLRPGDRGNAIVELQETLRSLGYLASITGTYDNATETAVRNFQNRNGLDADGVAGNQTLQKLYSNTAKPAY